MDNKANVNKEASTFTKSLDESASELDGSPILVEEIGSEEKSISFELSEESVLNGIIFSEILGKPKSKRRQRR